MDFHKSLLYFYVITLTIETSLGFIERDLVSREYESEECGTSVDDTSRLGTVVCIRVLLYSTYLHF